MRGMDRLLRRAAGALVLSLAALALVPLVDRALARREAAREVRALAAAPAPSAAGEVPAGADPAPLLALRTAPPLASWGSIGGCGAGGGATAPGGVLRWIGRNVTGGLVDVQVITTQSASKGNDFTTIAPRLATNLDPSWRLALNVPVLYKAGPVSVLGAEKTARLAGFGDVGVELARRLGAIGSHQVTLIAIAPTGAADAVRQGIVLPQHLQLGAGVPGATLQYEHTQDRDWGLVLLGGSATYNGWQNEIGDFRAPSATAHAFVGYLAGPLVPSAGLTLFGKARHDRERGADRPADRDPRIMLLPSVGLEWSSEWVAVLAGAILGLSPGGVQSVSGGVGISSSLF